MRFLFFSILIVFALAACSGDIERPSPATPLPVESIATIDPANTKLSQAQLQYNTYCAHCHGYGGEGQPEATLKLTEDQGYHTVPLHNSAGHTWQHPEQILFDTIKYGVQKPSNLYPMEAYEQFLSDDEIFAIIEYISIWWTDEQRQWHQQVTEQYAENHQFWTTNRDEP